MDNTKEITTFAVRLCPINKPTASGKCFWPSYVAMQSNSNYLLIKH